jgi:hypothetical protein
MSSTQNKAKVKDKNSKTQNTSTTLPKVNNNNSSKSPNTSPNKSKSNTSDLKLPSINNKSQKQSQPSQEPINELTAPPITGAISNEITPPIVKEEANPNATATTSADISTIPTDSSTAPSEPIITPTVVVPIPPEPVPEPEPVNNNGLVTLIYEQYREKFPIVNGSTTQENIDEVYCLSFVMPNCLVHLSLHDPATKRQLEIDTKYDQLFLREEPRGVYHGLVDDNTYYVYVEQEAEQLARDQAMMKQRLAMDTNAFIHPIKRDDGRNMESCSCVYGNPCVDEYGCKDWDNRFAIALKNGWKGF